MLKLAVIKTSRFLKIYMAMAVAAIAFSGGACTSTSHQHSKNSRDAGHAQAKDVDKGGEEISPKSLEKGMSTPISPEGSGGTALSRPKIVKVQEIENQKSGRKYFDVVDSRGKSSALAPLVDKSAKAVRITTFDNNSVQKDYPMRFGIVWERVLESFLELPLNVVDRSSGIIITDWITDRASAASGLSLRVFGAKDKIVRYKFTIRILDRGNLTQIKVIPFTEEVAKDKSWVSAKPGLMVAEAMFLRVERELRIPLPSERD